MVWLLPGKNVVLTKALLITTFLIALFLSGYWLKCQLGINVFPVFSWEEHLPFLNSFQRTQRASRSAVGPVFTSTFDELLPRRNWGKVWARDNGTVAVSIVSEGLHGSKALLIRSASGRDWAIPSLIRLEVSPGDTFDFSGYARATAEATGRMSVTLFDALDKVVKWDGALTIVHGAGWQRYANRLVVPDGTSYICFRLTGNGIGDFYIDDIEFVRVE